MTDNHFEAPNRREIKKMAKTALGNKGVLLMLIFAVVFCCLVFMSVELLEALSYYAAISLFPSLLGSAIFDAVSAVLFDALSLFAMAPAVLGTYRLSSALAAGQSPAMTEMFYYFGRGRYGRALAAFLIVSLPVVLYGYIVSALFYLIDSIGRSVQSTTYEAFLYTVTSFGLILLTLGVAFAIWLPYCRLFSVFASVVNGEGQPLSVCIRASLRATKEKASAVYGFFASFIPLCLLSILTVGMLFVIFTIPYMLISYFYYNAVLFGKDPIPARTTEVTFDER